MTADISNVINVSLQEGQPLAGADNPNVVAIMTSQQTGPLSSADRWRSYRDASQVEQDFGTASAAYAFATALFNTARNPVDGGGYLVMGYWRAEDEEVDATAATLTGGQLSEAATIGALQTIQDGALDVDVDGVTENITGLDFRTSTELQDVADLIDDELAGAAATLDNRRIIITSATTGASSTITFATGPGTGTYVGDILALAEGSGASLEQGEDAQTLTAESKTEAMAALRSEVKIKGAMLIDAPTDSERTDLANWGQSNNVLMYDVFTGDTYLEVDPTNTAWEIKLSGLTNYRMLYSKSGNRRMAASYMARLHTVNFGAENTAMTMNLKELSVLPESYTQTEIDAAKRVGLDIYTTIKETPVVLTSGANRYADERYNLIAFVDAVETDSFNLLRGTTTKIPQADPGVNEVLDTLEATSRRYRFSRVIAPGTWTSPDRFGSREVFDRAIETEGFYWLPGSLADQPQSERENRISPVFRGAIKLAGAFHELDVIVNINR